MTWLNRERLSRHAWREEVAAAAVSEREMMVREWEAVVFRAGMRGVRKWRRRWTVSER
jgi:hypothetical protein